jgi:hypothetical protein
MANNGFLDILEEELTNNFHYDYEINWDKTHFAVVVSFVLEVENPGGLALVDTDGVENDENLLYEDSLIFYNPVKTEFDEADYLAAIPYDEKGLSREFLHYLVDFLQDTVDEGLSALMDFLEDDAEEFSINWDAAAFERGDEALVETQFYKYPRY